MKAEITQLNIDISESYHSGEFNQEVVEDALRARHSKFCQLFSHIAVDLCSKLHSKYLLSAAVYSMILESPSRYINKALLECMNNIVNGGPSKLNNFFNVLKEYPVYASFAEELRNG